MKTRLVTIYSILISFGIILSALVLLLAIILQNTVFSTSFYQKVTTSTSYISMLKQAITRDLSAQSSYVAIPLENLTAGLDDKQLEESLSLHVQNTVKFLMYQSDFVKADYPVDLFYKPLETFFQSQGETEGYKPSQKQYDLLREVAKDSTAIVEKHVNLLNLDLVKGMSAFKQLHRLLYRISRLIWPAVVFLVVALALLLFLHRTNLRRALLYVLSAYWIVGALLSVPTLVLEVFGITRRLAIKTTYLKYAIDTWLTFSNRLFLIFGFGILVASTIGLLARILTDRPNLQNKNNS